MKHTLRNLVNREDLIMTVEEFADEFNIETDEDVSEWTIRDILNYVNDNGFESFKLIGE